jgi:hypothetical protein
VQRKKIGSSTRSRPASWRSCCARALTWMLLTWVLASCATGTETYKAPPAAPPPPPPAVPASLRAPLPPLPLASDSRLQTLLANQQQVGEACNACRRDREDLIRAVAEFEATAWAWYCRALVAIEATAAGCTSDGKPEPDG